MQFTLYFFLYLILGFQLSEKAERYRLKKSHSTITNHLYNKVNQNISKNESILQNQVNCEGKQNNKMKIHNVKKKGIIKHSTHFLHFIKLTSSSNWKSYILSFISLSYLSRSLTCDTNVDGRRSQIRCDL